MFERVVEVQYGMLDLHTCMCFALCVLHRYTACWTSMTFMYPISPWLTCLRGWYRYVLDLFTFRSVAQWNLSQRVTGLLSELLWIIHILVVSLYFQSNCVISRFCLSILRNDVRLLGILTALVLCYLLLMTILRLSGMFSWFPNLTFSALGLGIEYLLSINQNVSVTLIIVNSTESYTHLLVLWADISIFMS